MKRKLKIRLLALVLSVVMIFGTVVSVTATGDNGDNIIGTDENGNPIELCEICNSYPCACGVENEPEVCEMCGEELCICEDAEEIVEPTLYEQLMAATSVAQMYDIVNAADASKLNALTAGEIDALLTQIDALDPEGDDADTDPLADALISLPGFVSGAEQDGEEGSVLANNVHNVTQNTWYDTLSAATAAAANDDVIEVHNSFTETKTVKIQKQRLTIRAAEGKNPTISWTKTDAVTVPGATSYNCIVIYTDVTTYTYFGKGGTTGTLTFDATKASDADNKGSRARVLMHCGKNRLYVHDGIVITGGNTGGGDYYSKKEGNVTHPAGSGEITGMEGAGSGIYMYTGELVMMGGRIHNNYSLYGGGASHNYVGGGGGIYLHGEQNKSITTSMIMSGGTIDYNAAASGGGGGILVGYNSKLEITGGKIDSNVTRFSSGGGIGVRIGAEVKISGGSISNNFATNHGGGIFARGDAIPLEITGGTFDGNIAGNDGGAVLFWTVGDDVTKNTVKIGGKAKIINNKAQNGAGIAVGREVLDGVPIGNKAKLIIEGTPVISGNIASKKGGGIYMQSDEFSTAVNTVEISGGTISENAATDGGGIYVPGGTVTMTSGTFSGNEVTGRGAGIFTGGGTLTISNTKFATNIADGDGGGAFVQGGTVIMNSGSFENNEAENGGSLYINNGSFTMNDGTMTGNGATDGGAVYVIGGTFTMSNGTMANNKATGNGGAAYVSGTASVIGNITMSNGTMSNNEAVNGGAVYVNGGNFTMTSGTLTLNKAKYSTLAAAEAGSEGYGGAVYVSGGNIYVGVKDCTKETPCEAHKAGKPTYHPVVENNEAAFGGGLAVNGGQVYIYCCDMKNNESISDGTGENIFMSGTNGEIHHYVDGAEIGVTTNHGMVSIGGKLYVYQDGEFAEVKIVYHSNYQVDLIWEGAAPDGYYLNLPYCPEKWSNEQAVNHLKFAGWANTPIGTQPTEIRDKDDYQAIGDPVVITDTPPGEPVEINFYAVWAPETNYITYVYSLDGENISVPATNDASIFASYPTSYRFQMTPYTESSLATNPVKAGYKFLGWKMYATKEGAEYGLASGISNWDADAKSYPVTKVSQLNDFNWSPIGKFDQNFGNIVMVAVFEPQFTTLKIDKSFPQGADYSIDENQTFIFNISGQPDDKDLAEINMNVVVYGDGEVIVEHLPVGTYTITELTNWSWRYEPTNDAVQTVAAKEVKTINEPYLATFANERRITKWLNGANWCKNIFGLNNKGIFGIDVSK